MQIDTNRGYKTAPLNLQGEYRVFGKAPNQEHSGTQNTWAESLGHCQTLGSHNQMHIQIKICPAQGTLEAIKDPKGLNFVV